MPRQGFLPKDDPTFRSEAPENPVWIDAGLRFAIVEARFAAANVRQFAGEGSRRLECGLGARTCRVVGLGVAGSGGGWCEALAAHMQPDHRNLLLDVTKRHHRPPVC